MLTSLLAGLVWYQIIAHVGISAGIHRYWAHKSFKVSSPFVNIFEVITLYMSVLAGSRSPIGWISAHRMHHHFSDTEKDPHSPSFKGFWTVFFSLWSIKKIDAAYSKDLFANPRMLFFHKNWQWVWIGTSLITVVISPYLFLSVVLIPGILAPIGFGTVNAICHMNGKSRNLPLANLLVAGEGYHNEHHKGKSFSFHKFDLTGIVLKKLDSLKIITKLKD